jgi:transcriptional regulator with GAF, ATPase, and Fis domain
MSLLKEQIEVFERNFLIDVLKQHTWNITQSAKALGVCARTLHYKMKRYSIKPISEKGILLAYRKASSN